VPTELSVCAHEAAAIAASTAATESRSATRGFNACTHRFLRGIVLIVSVSICFFLYAGDRNRLCPHRYASVHAPCFACFKRRTGVRKCTREDFPKLSGTLPERQDSDARATRSMSRMRF
jgi:hypothetical protein